jgi:hypothetical protein
MEISDGPLRGVHACAIAGLPRELEQIATSLGLLPEQFGATRNGAFQADLDLPAGFWRVWPERRIALWVGRDPDQPPPLARWQPHDELSLLEMILRLGQNGIWLYEGRLGGSSGWSPALPLKLVYEQLRLHPERFDRLSGEFGDSSGRSQQAVVSRFGCVEAVSPTQAIRWLSIVYGLTSD